MQRINCLPEYIAIQDSTHYKLFINFIYKSEKTLDIPANVLFPMENVTIHSLTKFPMVETYKQTYIRKWNDKEYRLSHWSYGNSEIEIKYKGLISTIPVILLDDYSLLPDNQLIIPCPSLTKYTSQRSKYNVGLLVSEDPYRIPIQPPRPPVPVQRPVPVPVAVPVPVSVQRPVPAPAPVPVTLVLPIHVKKLIITEAIRNNEACPITSEEITMENAAVTSCGHVFTKGAIQHWLSMASSNNLCPICKIRCSI